MSTQVTINDIIPRTQIISTSGQLQFNTNWTANVASNVVVYARAEGVEANDATQVVSDSQYNVEFVGDAQTVRVTFLAGRIDNDIITIVRNTPADRLNLYTNTNFTPSMLNEDIGILTLVDQQAQLFDEQITPRYNKSESLVPLVDTILPRLEENQCWVMNADRTAIIATTFSGGGGGAPSTASYLTIDNELADLPNSIPLALFLDGFVANRSSLGDVVTRTLTGFDNEIDVSDGDGVAGAPIFRLSETLDFPGTFTVQNSTDIDEIINDNTFATASATSLATSLSIKNWVNSLISGFDIRESCVCSTTTNLVTTYSNGAAGVGATLTATGNGAFESDDITPAINSRVLVKDQTDPTENGIYTLTTTGDGSNPYILTRALDFNQPAEIEPGVTVIVELGTTLAGTFWVETKVVTTIGTDPIEFVKVNFIPLPLSLSNGGTNANLTASDGGIVWSNSSAMQILPGVAQARRMLQSGNLAMPAWSTATWPATTVINKLLYSSANNVVSELATGDSLVLITSSSGVPSFSNAIPGNVQFDVDSYDSGVNASPSTFLRGDGTWADPGSSGGSAQLVASAGPVVAPTANVPVNITLLNLTAGNWLVYGIIGSIGLLENDIFNGWVSETSATLPSSNFYVNFTTGANTGIFGNRTAISPVLVQVTTTKLVYLSFSCASGNSRQASGSLTAVKL